MTAKSILFVLLAGTLAFAQTPKLRPEMLVSTDWLAAHLNDPDLVVLCITSTDDFYSKGHIPGARQIPLSKIAVTRDGVPNELPPADQLQSIFAAAGVSNNSRIIIYGERFNLMAARAYFTLDYLSVADRVSLLDGGLDKWKAEGRPLTADVPRVAPGTLTVTVRRGILVELGTMRALVEKKSGMALLDARPTKEFTGEQTSEEVPKAGHIPGATGLYWMDLIVSRENPVLRPEAELRKMYAAANAHLSERVVTYCRSGMQSSFDYFVAKYLGYSPQMYDASFYEWSRQDLPVEVSVKK